MASLNKAILIGYLGADPDVRFLQNGDQVSTVRLATSEIWRDKQSGEKRESTEWHRVVFYRALAEIVGQYAKKGSQIYVEGRIKTRKWQDREGHDRYTTEIEATEMKILGSRGEGGIQPVIGDSAPPSQRQASAPARNPPVGNFDDLSDDIPF